MLLKKSRLEFLFLLSVLCYFLFVAFYELLGVPMLVDEARHGIWASQALSGFGSLLGTTGSLGANTLYENIASFSIPSFPSVLFPQMICFFVGAPIVYFLVPFIFVFGETLFALRIGFVVLGAATLVCMYYVVRRWFGVLVAMGAVVLMAVNSSFLRSVRLGVEREEVFQLFLLWFGIACFVKSLDKGKSVWLAGAGFLWGLALYAKLSFLGYIVGWGAAFCFMPVSGYKFLKGRVFHSFFRVLWFVLPLFCGMFLFISYNLKTGFTSVFQTFECLSGLHRDYGHRIEYRHLWQNTWVRVLQFWDFLCAHAGYDSIVTPDNKIGAVIALISICAAFVLALLKGRKTAFAPFVRILVVVYAVLFALSVFSPTWHAPEHMVAFLPFPQICMAVCFALCVKWLKSASSARALFWLLVFGAGLMEIEITGVFLRSVHAGAGTGKFMPSISQFRSELKVLNVQPILFFPSGGLGANAFYGLGQDPGALRLFASSADLPQDGNFVSSYKQAGDSFYFLCQEGQHADLNEHVLLNSMRNDPVIQLTRILSCTDLEKKHAWNLYQVKSSGQAEFGWVRDLIWNQRLYWLPAKDPRALGDVCRILGWKYDDAYGKWNTKIIDAKKQENI